MSKKATKASLKIPTGFCYDLYSDQFLCHSHSFCNDPTSELLCGLQQQTKSWLLETITAICPHTKPPPKSCTKDALISTFFERLKATDNSELPDVTLMALLKPAFKSNRAGAKPITWCKAQLKFRNVEIPTKSTDANIRLLLIRSALNKVTKRGDYKELKRLCREKANVVAEKKKKVEEERQKEHEKQLQIERDRLYLAAGNNLQKRLDADAFRFIDDFARDIDCQFTPSVFQTKLNFWDSNVWPGDFVRHAIQQGLFVEQPEDANGFPVTFIARKEHHLLVRVEDFKADEAVKKEAEKARKREAKLQQRVAVEQKRQDLINSNRSLGKWDITGQWNLQCEEAENYQPGPYSMSICVDSRGNYWAAFDLRFIEGDIRFIERRLPNASSPKMTLEWGSRDTGTGEMNFGSDHRGHLVFNEHGCTFKGQMNGAWGCLHLTAHKIEAKPRSLADNSTFSQYCESEYESERIGRWY